MTQFAILMALYDGDDALDVAFTFENITNGDFDEVLIVQDGPISRQLTDLVQHYQRNFGFKLVALEENKGLGAALNYGVRELKSSYFFRIDAGDFLYEAEIEKTKAVMLEEGLDLLGGQMHEYLIDYKKPINIRKVPIKKSEISRFAKFRSPFNHITICAKRSSVIEAGNYRSDLLLHEDYGLWIAMIQRNMKFQNRDAVLASAKLGANFGKRRGGLRFYLHEVNFVRKNIGFFKFFGVIFPLVRLPLRLNAKLLDLAYGFLRR